MAYLQTQPYALQHDEGAQLQSLGPLVAVKATTDLTGGVFNLFEVDCQPGYSTPLHIHYAEDVAVFVLEGALAFFWGSEQKEAFAGSFLFQPRGTPHGFRVVGAAPARILYLTFPAGMDRFLARPELLVSCSEAMMTAAQYKIEILGPLPE
jgi:quercetin dioxygenase-like cupin family protein